MLDDRGLLLLRTLLKRKNQRLTDLVSSLQLSPRQVLYSLDKVNEWLVTNGYQPIETARNKFYKINKRTESFMIAHLKSRLDVSNIYLLNGVERQNIIFLMQFIQQEYLSLNHFIIELDVSRSTVLGDLKLLREKLEKKQIHVIYDRENGYQLQGLESTIRYQMMQIVMEIMSEEDGYHLLNKMIEGSKLTSFTRLEEIVSEGLVFWHIQIIEKKLSEFIYMFSLILPRFSNSELTEWDQDLLRLLSETKEFGFSTQLLHYFNVASEQNVCYVTGWLLGISVGDVNEDTPDKRFISNLVDKIISRFEAATGTQFANKVRIHQQIYQHLRPAYYRLFFKLPIVNPLTEKIKTEYQEFYKIVKTIMKPFNSLFEGQIPDGEIAFLTIHFASFFFNDQDKIKRKKKAIVVCPNGIGSSVILTKELKNLLPELDFLERNEHQNLQNIPTDADLIFSTVTSVELLSLKKPYIVVSPIMSSREKFQVIQDVYTKLGEETFVQHNLNKIMSIIRKHIPEKLSIGIESEIYETLMQPKIINKSEGDGPLLSQIINASLIQLNIEANHWEEAIRKSAQPLLNNDLVTQSYIDDMINTTKELGPYIVITKHVALPHARPELGAKEIAISIATLKTPIAFGNKDNDPVKYVFCLSAKDSNTHLNAMAELVELLERGDFYATLDNAKAPQDIYDYILAYEKEEERT